MPKVSDDVYTPVVEDAKKIGEAVVKFVRAYDRWATSPDGIGGERFDAMVDARGELETYIPLNAEDDLSG